MALIMSRTEGAERTVTQRTVTQRTITQRTIADRILPTGKGSFQYRTVQQRNSMLE